MAYTNALSAYKETRIRTASPGQLIVLLYDGAVKQLDKSLELLNLNKSGKNDPARIELIGKAIIKARDIISELMVSLNFDQGGEIAQNLFSLYTWFNKELIEANIHQDLRRITVIRNQLSELRNAWAEIVSKAGAETESKAVTGVNIAG